MNVNAASRTNEKLYQARLLLQSLTPDGLASNDSANRSLQNGLLNAAVFSLHGAYLAFLLEIAVAHHIKLEFVESLHQLAPMLERKGIADLAVCELQHLYAAGDWPVWLFDWYRSALGDDGWKPASDKPKPQSNFIGIIDESASTVPSVTPALTLDVLEKLRIFIDEQRERLLEW